MDLQLYVNMFTTVSVQGDLDLSLVSVKNIISTKTDGKNVKFNGMDEKKKLTKNYTTFVSSPKHHNTACLVTTRALKDT